ncbi:hypothetical protein [Streptomyces dysideae]|uniref:Uncharacterized protein n=1 Tax=Streptomyces dysideae TaxID=909626 RepID=A0A117S1W5_9ACTN|nr:hypothetical protein [Streptomyces dysideae]KUO21469.1 hypothetical protein AQJ91_09035 [Streptomyces dysideae]
MPEDTVIAVVCDGVQFGYGGRMYIGGDTVELPAEHVRTWLARGLVELPEDNGDDGQDHRDPGGSTALTSDDRP